MQPEMILMFSVRHLLGILMPLPYSIDALTAPHEFLERAIGHDSAKVRALSLALMPSAPCAAATTHWPTSSMMLPTRKRAIS